MKGCGVFFALVFVVLCICIGYGVVTSP